MGVGVGMMVVLLGWSHAPVDQATTCDFEEMSEGGLRPTLGILCLPATATGVRMIREACGIIDARVTRS
jgi:hypothetical protein